MRFSPFKKFKSFQANAVAEFYSNIDSLLENELVMQLGNYTQHYSFTRLQHSLDVAYYSFFISKAFGWDSKSTARAGLLHDLYLYDCHTDEYKVKRHWRVHPAVALQNAKTVCELNSVEEDIIKKHMWLVTLKPPRYKEGYIVTFVDKYCAVRELVKSVMSGGKPAVTGAHMKLRPAA